ncbi:MAG: hypothetical protein E7437_09270 [Ruminococcaceae bacterium]|nr:hypothetical protein [Oscillospiraceae bacterium]
MRNLKECKAEIFRRSEIRIRRRRRRLLATCVPCVFCVSLSAVLLWPSAGNPTDLPVPDGLTMETAIRQEDPIAEIRLSGSQVSHQFTDPNEIRQIRELVQSLPREEINYSIGSVEEPEVAPETYAAILAPTETYAQDIDRHFPVSGTGDSLSDDDENQSTACYTLTFTYRDGTEESYTLTENRLTNKATGQVCPLSPEEAQTLLKLLKISG